MKAGVGAVVLLAAACAVSAQDAAPVAGEAKNADIRKLLEVTGAGRIGMQVVATMGPSLKQAHPNVPEAVWDELLAEFRANELTELAVPIYAKYLTAEDVRGLLAFYQSPLGQKLLSVQPQILQDSMAAGRQWGAECAHRVLKRLQERGCAGKVPTS